MAVNPVNTDYNYNSSIYKASAAVDSKAAEESTKSQQTTETKQKEDTFTKTTYTPDVEKVNAMKSDLSKNISAFKQMVQGLFQAQGGVANSAMSVLLEIDKATQERAQAAIAEGGEWSVENTGDRIIDFAKALSGGDPSKIEFLRGAIEDGFKAAEKIWGGELPEISYKTHEYVMKGLDAWKEEGVSATTAE